LNILVTGGAGYIGSAAAAALLTAGHAVTVFDDLSHGHRAAVPAAARFVRGDINDRAAVAALCASEKYDAVMHFAAYIEAGESMKDPGLFFRNNVGGTANVIEESVRSGVRRFVLSSTAAIFASSDEPLSEAAPLQPANAYGETKLAIERALRHYETAYGIRSMALRYFNAAGADPDGELGEDHAPERHLIPRAIDAALGRDTFAIFGDDYDTPDGTCLRDYIHVTDLASAHVLALDALRAGAASARYNLGNGRPTSVKDVVGSVERVLGRKVRAAVAPRRQGDPAVLFASSARITHELGWTPAFEDIDVIVGTASRWRDAHPQGYGDRTAA